MSTLDSSDYHFQLSFFSTPVWSLRFEYAMNPESCEREIRMFFYSMTQQDQAQFFTVNTAVKMATSFQGSLTAEQEEISRALRHMLCYQHS